MFALVITAVLGPLQAFLAHTHAAWHANVSPGMTPKQATEPTKVTTPARRVKVSSPGFVLTNCIMTPKPTPAPANSRMGQVVCNRPLIVGRCSEINFQLVMAGLRLGCSASQGQLRAYQVQKEVGVREAGDLEAGPPLSAGAGDDQVVGREPDALHLPQGERSVPRVQAAAIDLHRAELHGFAVRSNWTCTAGSREASIFSWTKLARTSASA